MTTEELSQEAAGNFIKAARFKVSIIFPEGRPLSGWCMHVIPFEGRHVQIGQVVFGIQVGPTGVPSDLKFVRHDTFHVSGGMVTWFPIREAGE